MSTLARLALIFFTVLAPLHTAGAQEAVEVDGVLLKGIVDLENGETQQMAHIREARSGKTFNVELIDGKLPKELKDIKTGQRIILRGKSKGQQNVSYDSLEEIQGPRVAQDLSRTPIVHGAGARTMLAVMVDFKDDQAVCGSNESMNKILFDKSEPQSLVNWVDKTSHGKFSVSGEVVRVQIDVDGSSSSCNYNSWADQADSALRAKGIDPDEWTHQQYVLPRSSKCSFGGVAYLKANRSWVRQCYPKTFSHELGHNFGMGHANHDKNGAYGDYTDTMGRYFFELNAPHREQMGWTPNEKILTANGDMTARLAPLNTESEDTELPQIIKVKRPSADDFVYISFRTKTGAWDSELGSSYYDHISIHRYDPRRETHTYLMETIGAGESYTIADGNVVVKNIAVTEDYVEVQITGAEGEACVRKAPTLTLPATVETVDAGKSFGGHLKVTNNNSQYCNPEVFKIEIASVPGIQLSTASAEKSLASGSIYTSEFLLQTDYSLGAGSHELPIRVLNKEHVEYVAQGKISFKTEVPTDKVDPDVTITAPKAGAQIEAMSMVEFKAHATDDVGVVKVEFLVNTNKVCEDTSSPYSCQFKMVEGKDVQLMAKAYDKAGNFKTHMVLVTGTPAVDKTAPSINIDSPSDGSEHYVGGLLKVKMSATDNVGVEKTRVYVNAIMKCEDATAPYECEITVPQGETQLMARSYDKAGNFSSKIININGKVDAPDTTAPTVRLDSPANGAEFEPGSTVKAGASASDNKGVVKVEFFVNDARKCRLYNMPYICEFSMPEAQTSRAYTSVYAIAYDAAGNSSKSNVASIGPSVTVDEINPVVEITSPADNTKVKAGEKVTIKFDARDNIGVNKVIVYQFNHETDYGFHRRCELQAPPFECELLMKEGGTSIYVYAWDKAGNLGRDGISLEGVKSSIVDNQSPQARILSPLNGEQFAPGDSAQISVDASDNIAIAKVKVYWKNDKGYWQYICSKESAPYQCSFEMPDQKEVKILAFALDTAGNRRNAFVTITAKGADSEKPVVQITSHQNGELLKAPQKVSLQLSATDNVGVERVLVYLHNSRVGMAYKRMCDLSKLPYQCSLDIQEGSNSIYVKAFDQAGNYGIKLITLKGNSTGEADTIRPVTKLISPSQGSSVKIGETFTVKASAMDNVGVTRMRLYVWHESTGYRILCDTANVTELSCPVKALEGEMRIMPRAYDGGGNFHSVLHKVYGK